MSSFTLAELWDLEVATRLRCEAEEDQYVVDKKELARWDAVHAKVLKMIREIANEKSKKDCRTIVCSHDPFELRPKRNKRK